MPQNSVVFIKDGDLLEHGKDEDIIDASEWNQVMQRLKEVINKNAKTLQSVDNTIVTGEIHQAGSSYTPQWYSDANDKHLYSATISNHGIGSQLTVHLYTVDGDQVYCKVKINANNDITVYSRVNEKLKYVIEG